MKKILWVFVPALITIPIIALFFFKKNDFYEERIVEIRRSRADCFAYAVDFNNQLAFNYYNRSLPTVNFSAAPKSANWAYQSKELNSEIRVNAQWTEIKKSEKLAFAIRINLGLPPLGDIRLLGSCDFITIEPQLTKIRCDLKGNLAFYHSVYLPKFNSDDNNADPFRDTLANLKLALEAGR